MVVWQPATPAEVHRLFGELNVPWWLAGGYAIELAVGRPLRKHSDIDVLLMRRDQSAVQKALHGWQWWAADPPGVLRRWKPGEMLLDGVQDIWCGPTAADPWKLQVMLDESTGDDWFSRRNPRVRRPLRDLGLVSADGIPYLKPEIQLFYKAKASRAKDELDFRATLPILSAEQKQWLHAALSDSYGDHRWLGRLAS